MVESVLPHPSPLPLGEGVAAARLDGANSVVANPASGWFRGSRRELLVGRILTPALARWERENRSPPRVRWLLPGCWEWDAWF